MTRLQSVKFVILCSFFVSWDFYEKVRKMSQWRWEQMKSSVPDKEVLPHDRNWAIKYHILNRGRYFEEESVLLPSLPHQPEVPKAASASWCSYRGGAVLHRLTSHHSIQLCLKVFIFWHNHLSAGVFVSTRTLSLLMREIFFPAVVPASSVPVWVVWLMETQGRNSLFPILLWSGYWF